LVEELALIGGGCELEAEKCRFKTLEKLEEHAQTQCADYAELLRNRGLNVKMACTVVHWTYIEDWPSALLVRKVELKPRPESCGPLVQTVQS
jgi:hypothetical protein